MSLKLLDYGRPNPFGAVIGKERYLAWPVHAYRVTLPGASGDDDGLNPFERVILKLLETVGAMDASALANETRIPFDLVKCILLRLRDKGCINEYNLIIKQKHNNRVGEEDNVPVFVTALVFRELATGKILPFLHRLDNTNPLQKKEGEEKRLRSIRWDDEHKQNPPAPRDVILALRAMKTRSAAFDGSNKMPAIRKITIVPSPESYYLECPIAIQKSDGEFRIADPFGNGFSLILESAFEQLLEKDDKLTEWLRKWKQSLSNPRPPQTSDSDQRPKAPFDNEANRQRYPKLVASLLPSRNELFRSISNIHASIEWALFYTCAHRPFEDAIAQLKFTGQTEHHALLESAALSIGLELKNHNFRPIREGKLLDFQKGQAELGTALAISILQAQKDDSHPLHHVASLRPDIINCLFSIKKKRDEKAHGKSGAGTPETELSDDALMRAIVHTLLPDIRFADTPTSSKTDKDARADALLNARAGIQTEFSFKVFNHLGTNLQNRLIHAECFWLSHQDDHVDARSFAEDLYAALQSAFEKQIAGKLPPDVSDSEFVSVAEKKTSDAGFGGALPECLCTVKPSAIRQTLQGAGQTLGACAIAFFLMSDADTLRSIADSQPSFVDDIANVIATRGHGNEPLLLPKANIKKLRKASYSTIKALMGT